MNPLGFSRQGPWSGLPFPSPMHESGKWKWSPSVVFDSSRPHGLQPTRLLRPWGCPGKSTGVGCHCLSGWYYIPLGWTGWISLQSKGLTHSQESSLTPQLKSINSSALSFPYCPTRTSIHDYWKNHSFDYMDHCQTCDSCEITDIYFQSVFLSYYFICLWSYNSLSIGSFF